MYNDINTCHRNEKRKKKKENIKKGKMVFWKWLMVKQP